MEQARIELVPYSAAWPAQFAAEARALGEVLAPWLAGEIQHIGSTAVPGLSAKPVIDIMAPVRGLAEALPAIEALRALDYVYFPYKREEMLWLCKPSPLHRTHHLHLVPTGSAHWSRRLVFRDALRRQPALASEYEELKQSLAMQHPNDREAYTESKSPFIESVLAIHLPAAARLSASSQAIRHRHEAPAMSIKQVGDTLIESTHRLSCHCGSVVLELSLPEGIVNPRRCDCSICRRKGAIVASVSLDGIRIVQGAEHLRLYQFNTRVARHHFCGICGIYTHHQRRSFPDQYGYNVGCLEGVNPFLIPDVALNDGVNHPADRMRA